MHVTAPADLPALEISSMPRLTAPAAGPIVGSCPDGQGETEVQCWKYINPDPAAAYDFWMLLTLYASPASGNHLLASQLIALDDGGLVRAVRHGTYTEIVDSTYIKTIKIEHASYGVVSLSRLKVREHYEALRTTLFRSRFRLFIYGADQRLLEVREGQTSDLPPLARGRASALAKDGAATVVERLAQADENHLPARDAIRFATAAAISTPADEIVVEDGELCAAAGMSGALSSNPSIAAATAARSPGLYIDLTEQSGSPSLVMTLYTLVPEKGPPRFLFGDFCAGVSYDKLHERIIIKKKRSWFRKKKKIIVIRKELTVQGEECGAL